MSVSAILTVVCWSAFLALLAYGLSFDVRRRWARRRDARIDRRMDRDLERLYRMPCARDRNLRAERTGLVAELYALERAREVRLP